MEKISELKNKVDIIALGEQYFGELVKSGNNYYVKKDRSITFNSEKQIFKNHNGSMEKAGSVLDLIMYCDGVDLAKAIEKLKVLAGSDTYQVTKSKILQRNKIANKRKFSTNQIISFAKKDLLNSVKYQPFTLEIDDKKYIKIHKNYFKLFETEMFPVEYEDRLMYLFKNIIGWDEYFSCPSIILKDKNGCIVDKASYRPQKPKKATKDWLSPKYYYKNPNFRGSNFLFPFQLEIEKIAKKSNYIIVGEGLKNALNALVYNLPFISIESSSSKINPYLIEYIKKYVARGYAVLCMFDGDGDNKDHTKWKAGKKAYEEFILAANIQAVNHFDFNSNMDFTTYMTGNNNERS